MDNEKFLELRSDKTLKDFILDDNISAICIPTCGYVIEDYINKNFIYPIRITKIGKELIELSDIKTLEEEFGERIRKNGNIVQIVRTYLYKYLVSFPVNEDWVENPLEENILDRFRKKYKYRKYVPAVLTYADPEIVERSIVELSGLDQKYDFKKILIPNIKIIDESPEHNRFIKILTKYNISKKIIIALNYIDI